MSFNNVAMVIKFIGINEENDSAEERWSVFDAVYEFDNKEQFDLSVYVDNPVILDRIRPQIYESKSKITMLAAGEIDYIKGRIVLKASKIEVVSDNNSSHLEGMSREFVDFSND